MHTQTHQSESTKNWMAMMPSAMQECIKNCLECYQICSHVAEHCLKKGGKHADPKHIKLLEDCAKICNLSADFMLRRSEFHTSTCGACAEVCNACAESCEALASDDPMMKACAEACKKCASSCSSMAKMQ